MEFVCRPFGGEVTKDLRPFSDEGSKVTKDLSRPFNGERKVATTNTPFSGERSNLCFSCRPGTHSR